MRHLQIMKRDPSPPENYKEILSLKYEGEGFKIKNS